MKNCKHEIMWKYGFHRKDNHPTLKDQFCMNCKKTLEELFIGQAKRIAYQMGYKEGREEVIEEIEKVFDQFRSSNQKVKGKRRFGVANFEVGARDLHRQILQSLKSQE